MKIPVKIAEENSTPTEEWRGVVGYEGIYEVSNLGRVRSLDRIITQENYKRMRRGRILRQRYIFPGAATVFLSKEGKVKSRNVGRLVAIAFILNPVNKREVNHIDGNRNNNNMLNLEWVTPKENIFHAVRTGLIKSGSDSYRSKLTEDIVKVIRKEYQKSYTKSVFSMGFFAKKYSVSKGTIQDLLSRKTWKQI